jgi:hypothetical protein
MVGDGGGLIAWGKERPSFGAPLNSPTREKRA